MTVRDIALGVKRWALSNKMMGDYPVSPDVDMQLIRNVFGQVGVPAATHILQNRGISYIGVNEPRNEIIIFTKKKLSAREQKSFQSVAFHHITEPVSVIFMHSNIAQAGGNPPPPPGVPPFHQHNGRYTCGSSVYIGSEKGAGTLGCLVRDQAGTLYGLSNNHVTGGLNYAVPGLPIVGPGMLDVTAGGKDPETLGHHHRSYPFIDGYPDIVDATGNLDAAIFKIQNPDRVSSMQRQFYDTPATAAPLAVNMAVEKVGRTSGKTSGTVIAELIDFEPVNCHIDIIKGYKVIWYKSLFTIKTTAPQGLFSHGGDSGSVITTTDNNGNKTAVGIIVAGNDEGVSFALCLRRVLTYFGVDLVSGHNV